MAIKVAQVQWNSNQSEIKQVREKVYVCEYRIPQEIEFDQQDNKSEHVLIKDDSGQAIATGRIGQDGKISRIAVLMKYRRSEVPKTVINSLLSIAKAKGLKKILIDSELEKVSSYTNQGFSVKGNVFMDLGIAKQTLCCDIDNFSYPNCLLH